MTPMSQSATLDRRQFLRRSAAVAGLTALPGLSALGAAEQPDDFGGFLLGAQSYTFRDFNTEQALKRIKDCGLHYVEFFQKHAPANADPAAITALLKLCKEYDVKPACWGVQGFTKDHDANRKTFEFGKALGVAAFSASPDPDSFDSLDKLCDEYKIAIGIHPHGPVGGGKLDRWYSAEIILKAVKDHHPLIGACLDTGHLIRADILGKKLDPAQEIRTMGARNFGIHLKDNDNEAEKSGRKRGGDANVIIGKGVLDVPGVLKALREVKFKYLISIEYEANAKEPTDDVKQCVAVFKESVKKIG
jgi:sugar phosphate isomerase/epimerase